MKAKRPPNFRKYDHLNKLPTWEEYKDEYPYDPYDDLTKSYWNQEKDPRNLKYAKKKTRTT